MVTLSIQAFASLEKVWTRQSMPRDTQRNHDGKWVFLDCVCPTVVVCIGSTIGPYDIVFWIEVTIPCEHFFIRKHHPLHFVAVNVLTDPLTTSFSDWLLIFLELLDSDFSVAFFVQIKVQYPLDGLRAGVEVLCHRSKALPWNARIESSLHQRDALFCTSRSSSPWLRFDVNRAGFYVATNPSIDGASVNFVCQ